MPMRTSPTLPNKTIVTRGDIKNFLSLSDRQADRKIYALKQKGLIETVRKGVFINTGAQRFDEREKIKLATSLFPTGYVTGYEALRYWSVMSPAYDGLCLRVDWSLYVAVPHVTSRPVKWSGYTIKSFQMNEKLSFGVRRTPYGLVAEPEKAVLDILYMGREPDNIEFDMLDMKKLRAYAAQYPPRIKNRICR